jgi:hypothetical protein
MDALLEFAGGWIARAHAAYGLFLLVTTFLFANVAVLGAAVWALVAHARGRTPWPWLPAGLRREFRLAVELAFGFINPVLYLLVLQPFIPELRASGGAWHGVLTAGAWVLLTAFWAVRLFGAAVEPGGPRRRRTVLALLGATFIWLLTYIVKDLWSLWPMQPSGAPISIALNALRILPLYLVPGVLLWEYIRLASARAHCADGKGGLFVLEGGAARVALAGTVALALLTAGLSAHRRSDANVQALVGAHRQAIADAGRQYGVDPRLIASIVYVTHRDQLSPFRDELERMLVSAWGRNMRGEVGIGPPENVPRIGTDENPLLNRAFDVSVGLAQIKPRTAQTASVLATGLLPDELPRPARDAYRDVEPIGESWDLPAPGRLKAASPLPVPAARHVAASALLDDRTNLDMCALILALYQHQWESSNPAWSLRDRPEILATLYQLGFARSRPHAAPRSNAFGNRVREVLGERWLDALLEPPGSS